MRAGIAITVAMAMTRIASADVNLLKAVPTTVAVSSTVANAKILPEHLVDGSLDTAWNSRTGDLVGAWIAVRFPPHVHVTSIKLTAGFTKGDYFTQNVRIKKVRVTHGTRSVEAALDPANRGLQTIAIDGDGGDYKVAITEIVAGSKPSWREIAVSEFEVWGTPGAGAQPTTPIMQVGSLDPQLAASAACVTAMFPSAAGDRIGPGGDVVAAVDAIRLGATVIACRIEHHPEPAQDTFDTTTDLGVMQAGRPMRGDRVSLHRDRPFMMPDPNFMLPPTFAVAASAFALSAGESLLRVDETDQELDPEGIYTKIHTTLYRVVPSGLAPVLAFDSTTSHSRSIDDDTCTPVVGKPDLELHCEHVEHDDVNHGTPTIAKRVEHYRWTGSEYAKN